jgi:hypothetical protein
MSERGDARAARAVSGVTYPSAPANPPGVKLCRECGARLVVDTAAAPTAHPEVRRRLVRLAAGIARADG